MIDYLEAGSVVISVTLCDGQSASLTAQNTDGPDDDAGMRQVAILLRLLFVHSDRLSDFLTWTLRTVAFENSVAAEFLQHLE